MLLRQMKYFVSVVDCGSFTEAGEQNYISQSAISQQIQALEKDLGVRLLIRENRKFSLTPAGEYFYSHCRGILEEAETLRRETVRLGKDSRLRLRIGYLRCYSGLELHEALAEFSRSCAEVSINVVKGTHEELYDHLRFGTVDLVLTDQRRAFSDEYVNFELLRCGCYAELSAQNRLCAREYVTLKDLGRTPCILISSGEQQSVEEDYYRNTLGFRGNFLFAENLEEGRLMAAGNRGFLPVDGVGTLPPEGPAIRRLPICRNGEQLSRSYCVFWRREQTNDYIEKFAGILHRLLNAAR